MYFHDQSQKIKIIENNVMCLDFIDPLQKSFSFHYSSAKIVHILKITCKEVVYIRYQSWEGMYIFWEIVSMNALISDEMITHFSNWPEKCFIINFQ